MGVEVLRPVAPGQDHADLARLHARAQDDPGLVLGRFREVLLELVGAELGGAHLDAGGAGGGVGQAELAVGVGRGPQGRPHDPDLGPIHRRVPGGVDDLADEDRVAKLGAGRRLGYD